MKKLLIALLFACCYADAAVTRADEQEIAGVIDKMFVALQRGDDKTAFALQTEDTKKIFKTADQFAAELRRCCTALHDTVEQIIVNTAQSGARVVAFVLMIDKEAYRWSAQFILEKHVVWQIDEIHIKLIDESGNREMSL
jgi:hypothetical protein